MTERPGLSKLEFVVQGRGGNYPTVRLLIDGEDRLDPSGSELGNDPEQILHNGALLPHEPTRRIAFYGCRCGVFGCFVIAGLVTQHAGVVTWSDFRTVTAAYDAALPGLDGVGEPDPAFPTDGSDDFTDEPDHRKLTLPDLTFDADHYHRVVQVAAADRSWETHARAVLRHLRASDPSLGSWTTHNSNHIEFAQTTPGEQGASIHVALEVPPGPAADVAARLVNLRREGTDFRDIERDHLWR